MAEVSSLITAEIELRAAWTNVLGCTQSAISSNADFFELGGGLQDALRLAAVQSPCLEHLTASDILRNPSFGEMARLAYYKSQEKQGLAVEVESQDVMEGKAVDSTNGESDPKAEAASSSETVGSSNRHELIRRIKETLRQTLPAYMVPDLFIPIRRMPLNPSGKMDRKKVRTYAQKMTSSELQRFANQSLASAGSRTSPSTSAELRMASAWAKVLGIERENIGAYDDFFHKGGDSVRAMRLVTQARFYGLTLSVQQVFRFPSLAHMAAQATELIPHHEVKVAIEPFSMISNAGQHENIRRTVASVCGIDEKHIDDVYPCTPLQEGLMALSLKDSGRYVGQFVYKLSPHVDTEKFRRVWDHVAQNTTSLRTRFLNITDSGLMQVVLSKAPAWKHAIDLKGYLAKDELRDIGFGGPCSHFGLVQESEERYFVLTAHHAIYDGWSINLLLERFEKAYSGSALQPVPGFNTFLQYCHNIDHEQSKAFWTKELSGAPQCEFPPGLRKTYSPQQHQKLAHRISLPSGYPDSSITISSKVRAAWALLLSTYSGGDAVLFAMTLNGRNVSVDEIDQVVGPTFATVPVHLSTEESLKISEFLNMVQSHAASMMPHEQYGLHNIKRINSELDAICDIQSLLIIQNTLENRESVPCIEDVTKSFTTNKMFHSFALSTECSISQAKIEVDFTYDPEAISTQQLLRVAKQFEHLMLQLVTFDHSSSAQLSDISRISSTDRQEIATWNATVYPPQQALVHELVERQVELQPHAPAICSWDGKMTFGELNEAASRLAVQLQGLGVSEGVLVPLVFEKSIWTIVSMYAVLKAGGAYAALDPAHPEIRLQALVQKLDAHLILTSRASSDLCRRLGEELLVIDREYIANLPVHGQINLSASVKPEHPAIILFTSGSTGLPKGIVIDHTAFTSSMLGHTSPLRFDQSKRVLQFTAYTSDVSMAEIFTSLSVGACVCVPSDGERMNSLAAAINRLEADWAYLTPSAAILFQPSDVPTLKTLVFGGEVPSRENLTRWAPALYLINVYGPAETSIWTSCNPGLLPTDVCSHIGNTLRCHAYVALPNNPDKLAPIGGVGELIVEGPNIARGYLNDPLKTSVSFLSSTSWLPESSNQQYRLYRTGDLVRYLDDGRLDFIGRRDTQVKLRGLRVELGEVEERLRSDLKHSELAVEAVSPNGQQNVQFLVAFIALRSDRDVVDMNDLGVIADTPEARSTFRSWTQGLESRLSKVLPAFMVPSFFVPVWRLPLTGSAKTDRKALRSIGGSMTVQELHQFVDSTDDSRSPVTQIELLMQRLWAKVLQATSADIYIGDNFFRHGGDSIRAMRLVSLAREEGMLLTVAEVLKYSTFSAMCERAIMKQDEMVVEVPPFSLLERHIRLEHLLGVVAEHCAVAVEEVEDAYPCTPLQEGLIMQAEKIPGSYIARMVFRLPVDLDVILFQEAWNKVARSAVSLRTRFIETGDGLLQVVLRSTPVWNHGQSLSYYMDADQCQSMTMGKACCRFALVDGSNEKYFVLTAHHAIFDGWSLPLLFQQVGTAYFDRVCSISCPPFNSFIQYYLSIDKEASAQYWLEALNDMPASSFPVSQPFHYQPKTHESLYHTVSSYSHSPKGFMLSTRLRTAWAILLGSYTGSSDVAYAVTVNGRSAPVRDIEKMMSPTFTTVPIRIMLPTTKEATLGDLLGAVQIQSAEMIPHEQFGLQNIRHLSPEIRAACNMQSLLVINAAESNDEASTSSDLGLEKVIIDNEKTNNAYHSFALSIECSVRASNLDLEITFDPEIIDRAQITRMAHQLEYVFLQMNDSRKLLADVDIISPHDRRELAAWNSQSISASTATIPELIYEQTTAQPNAIALHSCDEGKLSYQNLEELSSRLARSLTAAGILKGDLVPLLFEKSIWTVVTMLAVMKAGAAFAALDPAHPIERLIGLNKKLSAKILLSSVTWAEKAQALAEYVDIIVVSPDYVQSSDRYEPDLSQVSISNEDTAFILFTSGSTGLPKGIVIDHSAFTSSIKGHAEALQFRRHSRNFQFTAYTSDVSMGEIFTSLAVGACVCVPSDYERINDLSGVMNRLEVDWAFFTPSVASLLRPADAPMLRTMVLGGETASPELIEKWAPALQLINSFGPAETSIWISRQAPAMTPVSSGSNIGVGIGCRTWITDPLDHNKLAPIGAIGELVVEGPNVAKEYLNDEAKTAAVFIRNASWQSVDGSRLFRTGDLVRYISSGDLHFIGRSDTQIKLRGLRIDLNDVEHQLRLCLAAVKELAVEAIVPHGNAPSGKMLAAFIASEAADLSACAIVSDSKALARFHETIRELPSQLSRVLPSHMVPTAYFPITKMPLSGSAKTDRNVLRKLASALTVPEIRTITGSTSAMRQPTSPEEISMQKLWSQTLGVPATDLSVDDSFFLRGGDSVAAMRLVSFARANKLKLSVERIFKYPTLTDMAMQVESMEEIPPPAAVAPFSLIPDVADLKTIASATCNVGEEVIEDIYPCTPLQEGLVALSVKNSGSYIAQFTFTIPRELDIERFSRSWNKVAENVPSLRTRFIETHQGALAQVIVSESIKWKRESDLAEYLRKDKVEGMLLGQPTARFAIIQEIDHDGETQSIRSYFVLTAHHATYDGWSLRLLMEAVARTYAAEKFSSGPNLNVLVAQLAKGNSAEAQSFWRAALADAPQSTFPNPSGLVAQPKKHLQAKHSISIPSDWQKQSEFTAATRIRAAWSLLIGAYSGTQDVMFAASLNGRTVPIDGIEKMIAPTLTTVPVRIAFDKQRQTVGDFMRSVQNESTAMMAFENYGLQNIKRLSPEINAACNLQTLLVIDSVSADVNSNSLLGLEPISGDHEDAVFHSFPLSLECAVSAVSVAVVLTYDPQAIDSQQVLRLVSQFDFVLTQLSSAQETKRLTSIELLSPEDRLEISDWNRNVYVPSTRTVHSHFQEMALSQPNSPALCSWEGEMSYSTLDDLSSTLAQYLISKHMLGQKDLVPVLFEKSIWAVVSMLAILKAGGAVVPLDPAHPVDRLVGLVKKVEARLVLASTGCSEAAHQLPLRSVTVGKGLLDDLAAKSRASTAVKISQMDPAFILFTSGSTGQPKGIVIDHLAFSSSITGHASMLRFRNGSRNLQFTAYTSDVSFGEIFTSLAVGACVCIPSDFERMNDLAGAMERMKVDWAFLTPSVATLLDPARVPSLKCLLFGGETATYENIQAWADKVYLINSFGPAECSIWTNCNPGISTADQGTNIGFGLGCLTWITDPTNYKTLMPIGAVGELVIQGPNVAQGYLKEPLKTKSVFVDDAPWIQQGYSSQRVYRTGDLVRYLPDGKVHFIGRRDTQVKLNGLRIEIGEVEAQLRFALPGVTEIAVEVVKPKSENPTKILAAFLGLEINGNSTGENYIAESPEALDHLRHRIRGVQAKLRQVLPAHMIPKVFIPLSRLPHTASSKTDRNVLRHLVADMTVHEMHSFMAELEFCEPETEEEAQMQKLWSITLRLPASEIGANDSFFERGGDSIAAMRLVSEARRIGLELSVEEVFRYPLLSTLARKAVPQAIKEAEWPGPFKLIDPEMLDELMQAASYSCEVPSERIEDVFPCTPLQTALISVAEKIPGSYIAGLTFTLPSGIPTDQFQAAWETVYQSTQILRTRFFWNSESDLYQAIVRDNITWTAKDTLMAIGQPLSQFSITLSETQATKFTLRLHHSIYDEHTLALLLSLFHDAYYGNTIYQAPGFSMFVKSLEAMKKIDAQLFWQSYLDQAPIPSFPSLWSAGYDPVPSNTINLSVKVSPQESSGVTMATRIQAAWSFVVGSYSDSEDVVFGMTLSGRSSALPDIERILGPTITTVPVRTTFKRSQRLWQVLKTIQRQSTERLPFEHFGMQNIRRLSSEAQGACNFQNLLVVQHSAVTNKVTEASDNTHFLRLEDAESQAANFTGYSLITECGLDGDQVHIKLHFDPALLDSARVRRVIDHFGHVLQQVCGNNDSIKLANLDHISPSDILDIRHWNSRVPSSAQKCVHDILKNHTEGRADLPALSFGGESTSYGELDRASDKLARYFISSGVEMHQFVPICFEKSAVAVICMLGIWKAGGAYVPLDPSHPKERHGEILSTISAGCVVTSTECAPLYYDLGIKVIAISREFLSRLPETGCFVGRTMQPEDPAYAIFTSGSTGKPKGVVVQHDALTTSATSLGEALGLSESSRFLQFAAYTFDASVGEIWVTLLFGGCVCIPDEKERREDITRAIKRMRVTNASFSPSFVNVLEPRQVPTIETLLVAGEAIMTSVIEKWANRVNLINGYGPTEAAILCMTHKVDSRNEIIDTIGKGTSVVPWIVDSSDHNVLLPIGCVGELLLQGPALAKEYLNEPAKTAQAFVTNPLWASRYGLAHQNQRFYKTGDLVRYGADGTLRFVTRKDNQVKVRGHRIELEEIETKAYRIMPNAQAVVAEVVSSRLAGESRTIALFVVGRDVRPDGTLDRTMSESADLADLERGLRKVLPSYMIPSMYIDLKTMPLNQNRKADRRKLQEYVQNASIEDLSRFSLTKASKVRPQTPRELLLAKLWSQVLQRAEDEISIHDSFVRSGGDSIMAIKLLSLARSSGLSLPMEQLLKEVTLQELAASISEITLQATADTEPFALLGDEHKAILKHASAVCSVPEESISDIFPCTVVQKPFLKLNEVEPGFRSVQWAFEMDKKRTLASIESAWGTVVSTHALLRTRVFQHSSRILQAVVDKSPHWSHGTDLSAYLEHDKAQHFRFGTPLTRQAVFQDSATAKIYFVWTCSHAIYDLVSISLMLDSFKRSLRGDVPLLAEIPYTRFVSYMQRYGDNNAATPFWRAHFHDCQPTRLFKPLAHPIPNTILRGHLPLPLLPRHTFTLATYIQSAWAIASTGGTGDSILALSLSGRDLAISDIETVAGPTATEVPLRLRVHADMSTRSCLQAAQQAAAGVSRWQHTGVAAIAACSADAAAALAAAVPLAIHAAAPLGLVDDVAGAGLRRVLTRQTAPGGDALGVTLALVEGGLQVLAVFDGRAVGAAELESLLRAFARILRALLRGALDLSVAEVLACDGDDDSQGGFELEREEIVDGAISV